MAADLRLHGKKILAVEFNASRSRGICGVAGQNHRQSGFSRPVGTHYGMYFSGLDFKVYSAQDLTAVYLSMQIVDF